MTSIGFGSFSHAGLLELLLRPRRTSDYRSSWLLIMSRSEKRLGHGSISARISMMADGLGKSISGGILREILAGNMQVVPFISTGGCRGDGFVEIESDGTRHLRLGVLRAYVILNRTADKHSLMYDYRVGAANQPKPQTPSP